MSVRSLLLSFGALFGAFVLADTEQAVLPPTTAVPRPTARSEAHGYAYIGCWNETAGFRSNGGARALAGGKDSSDDSMTTSACLEYCSKGSNGQAMQYAGLESGRECWCGDSLSAMSEKLNESARCISSCLGNASEICGGQLALTLYNLTSMDLKTGIAWSQFSGVAGYGTLALVTLIIAAAM